MRNKVFIILILLCAVLGFSSCSQSQSNKKLAFDCDYVIDADLTPSRLTYSEQAIVNNLGKDGTTLLYFHIYANKDLEAENKIKVVSITGEDGEKLRFKMLNDDSLIQVKLSESLEAGQAVTVTFQCEEELPEMSGFCVYGIAHDGEIQLPFFNVQLAVYDQNGWDTEPSNPASDGRYSACGDYELSVAVPSEYEVASMGVETGRETRDGKTVYRFQADGRRDLILAACTDYYRLERDAGGTKILGYINSRKSSDMAESVMDDVALALEYFSSVLIEYPYESLVIISDPWSNTHVSLECSGLIVQAIDLENASTRTVAHEVAHQWFYFLVGNNENREAWLDEGFAEFFSSLCLEAMGDIEEANRWLEFDYEIAERDYSDLFLNEMPHERSELLFVYVKGSRFLQELMDAMGREAFLSAVSDYCQQFAGHEATSQDFISMIEKHSSEDMQENINDIVSRYLR